MKPNPPFNFWFNSISKSMLKSMAVLSAAALLTACSLQTGTAEQVEPANIPEVSVAEVINERLTE